MNNNAERHINLLTESDRRLVRNLLQYGEVAFDDEKYSQEDRIDFLNRPEVLAYIENVEKCVLVQRSQQQETVRAFTLKDLSKLAQPAVNVLARALKGKYYDKGEGKDPPTSAQVDAAKEILRLLGADGRIIGQTSISGSQVIINNMGPDVNELFHDVETPAGRERVRKILESVLSSASKIMTKPRAIAKLPDDRIESDLSDASKKLVKKKRKKTDAS